MLAYAIIAFELAILYTVFWYVFLREPRPYRVQGNTWGGYAVPKNDAQANALQERQSQEQQLLQSLGKTAIGHQKAVNEQAIYEEWNLDVPQTAGELIRSRTKGVYLSERDLADEQKRSTFAGQFLTKLSDRLNRINVKIP